MICNARIQLYKACVVNNNDNYHDKVITSYLCDAVLSDSTFPQESPLNLRIQLDERVLIDMSRCTNNSAYERVDSFTHSTRIQSNHIYIQ